MTQRINIQERRERLGKASRTPWKDISEEMMHGFIDIPGSLTAEIGKPANADLIVSLVNAEAETMETLEKLYAFVDEVRAMDHRCIKQAGYENCNNVWRSQRDALIAKYGL